MNKILSIISTIILLSVIAFDVNYLNYSSPIEHSNYKNISLEDFKGLNRINSTLNGSNEFAFINTEIKFIGNDYPYVKAFFHPSRSYVYNSNSLGSKNLLTHELYHFHITEYIARKIRKEISLIKNNKEDINIRKLILSYKEDENRMQKRYDKETYHSYYMGEQLRWQIKVDSLLNTLKQYK